MTSTNEKYQRLTDSLRRAASAAEKFAAVEDSGTCNFDSPALDFRANGMTKARAEAAIKAAGLRCYDWRCFGVTMLVICGFQRGQAYRHTKMAEAFYEALKADGYDCTMYYQAD